MVGGSTYPPPPTNPPKPEVCEADMGSTLQAHFMWGILDGYPTLPEGWDPWRPLEPFDWNQDGVTDELLLAGETVRVVWADGEVVVSGVQTDYWSGDVVTDDSGREYRLEQTHQHPHRAAAVADVTGDGLVDLIVQHGGHVAVLIGQGAASESMELAFEDVGRKTLGWRSEPVRPLLQDGAPPMPLPVGHMDVLWDFNGDGATDFRWWIPPLPPDSRTGSGDRDAVYYLGVPCRLP